MNEFREIRQRLGLSQADLAGLLGMSQSAISRIETSPKPRKRDLLAIKALMRSRQRAEGKGEAA